MPKWIILRLFMALVLLYPPVDHVVFAEDNPDYLIFDSSSFFAIAYSNGKLIYTGRGYLAHHRVRTEIAFDPMLFKQIKQEFNKSYAMYREYRETSDTALDFVDCGIYDGGHIHLTLKEGGFKTSLSHTQGCMVFGDGNSLEQQLKKLEDLLPLKMLRDGPQ